MLTMPTTSNNTDFKKYDDISLLQRKFLESIEQHLANNYNFETIIIIMARVLADSSYSTNVGIS